MDEFTSLMEEFNQSPVKTTQSGKKLSTTACVNEIVNAIMQVIVNTSADTIGELIVPKIQEQVKEAVGLIPPRIEVKVRDQTKIVEGVTHSKFEEVLNLVNLDFPVYMVGKAGTGKNHICKQVCEALGLEFYFTNCVTQEYKLTGFIDANGIYQKTQFYDAFTKGGLFFLDEMDASIPETLVILNAAIENRYFDFPTGKVEAHPNFRVIAAGNTYGTGADINYTGRYSLDKASLDRFATVYIDYDPRVEESMADGDANLLDFVRAYRIACEKACVESIASYRTIKRMRTLRDVINDRAEIIRISLTKGMDTDTRNVVMSRLNEDGNMAGNVWARAFSKI